MSNPRSVHKFLCMIVLMVHHYNHVISFSPMNVNKSSFKKQLIQSPTMKMNSMLPSSSSDDTTRSEFLQKCGKFLIVGAAFNPSIIPSPANAADDKAAKGTKADPKFQLCLSNCMYECTKPKVEEQKTRAECLPECKKSCATTKEQLMKGTPTKAT